MYTGHVAVALGARGLRRDLPLWVLVLAAQACDWVELSLRATGMRGTASLYSHAYPLVLVAALAAAALVWIWKRSLGATLTVLIVYLSHPAADYVTGFKRLWLGGPRVGLAMTNRPSVDFVVQGMLCVVGAALYWRSLPQARRHRLSAALPLVVLLSLQGLSDLVLVAWSTRRRPHASVASRLVNDAGDR